MFLASGIDRHDAGVDDHNHADDQIVFLEDSVRHQRDQVQRLLFASIEFHDGHQKVGPREHGAAETHDVSKQDVNFSCIIPYINMLTI